MNASIYPSCVRSDPGNKIDGQYPRWAVRDEYISTLAVLPLGESLV